VGVIGRNGRERAMTLDDVLVVAPYNMQVNLLRSSLPDGTRISGPMRELIEDLWPELANKLPPKAN
jgi:hypothetical protein